VVYPESDIARHFNDLVYTFIQSSFKDKAAETEIRTWLTLWRDNDAKLHPMLEQSFLLQEMKPLSESLAEVGVAGLLALDYLGKGEPCPESLRTSQLALIERAEARQADLLLLAAPPVQQLLQASAGQVPPN